VTNQIQDGITQDGFTIAAVTDKVTISRIAAERWGSHRMTFGFQVFDLSEIDALGVMDDTGRILAIANWTVRNNTAYLCVLQSLAPGKGHAKLLLQAVLKEAKVRGARNIRAMLTNDNTNGMIFYQRNGFRFSNLFVGAVDAFRSKEPTMMAVGLNGINVRDTLELECDV
jgi:GNAT superfamily N-acetyltransferase